MSVSINEKYVREYVDENEVKRVTHLAKAAYDTLISRSGAGNAYLGWLDLPEKYDREEYDRVKKTAREIQEKCDVLIVIGIGGSYLGARAAIEFIKSPFYNVLAKNTPDIYFAGQNVSASYLHDIISICKDREVCLNVISKSGTTTESAVSFRIFREFMEDKYGEDGARDRIYVTTDRAKGKLREFSDLKKYQTFTVPDDIGGRYSVLSSVGLLPIAVAGCDIDSIMAGARDAMTKMTSGFDDSKESIRYAILRNILYNKGKIIEVFAAYEPNLQMLSEWWKQLFGESEGKDTKSLFPSSMIFSTDLHSLGQYVQQGLRTMFETVIDIKKSPYDVRVPHDELNADGLNFLSGKDLHDINRTAMTATLFAHSDGNVPNIVIEVDERSEYTFGYLVYFFEFACAMSGYMLGVNPFDQPGVEAYKKNMYALLGKPGFEDMRKELEARINI